MKTLLRISLVAVLAMVPGWGAAWRALNWHEVFPISETEFEVVSRVGSGAADFWCGAGDFARSKLGAGATQRIYIWRAIGPSVTRPGKKAVQFSFSPPPGANVTPGYSLSVKAVGDNLTSAAAFQYCLGQDPFDPFLRRGW
jgi:hypothetical protein